MAAPIILASTPRFELFLALARATPGFTASEALALAASLPDGPSLESLSGALAARRDPRADLVADFTNRIFASFWRSACASYDAAARRLEATLDADPRTDLGVLFGFDIALDPRHRGLRQHGAAARRIPPNRLAAINLYPSALNPGHEWHLQRMEGDKYLVHLPIQDETLAAQCLALLREPAAAVARPRAGTDPAIVFRALGDASRFAMVTLLAREELTGAELGRRLGLSTPAVTHHLNELRRAGLIDERRQGAAIHLKLRRVVFLDLGARTLAQLDTAAPTALPQRSRRKKTSA